MTVVFHGTTFWRARRILKDGPDPDFVAPCETLPAHNFSACLTFGPFDVGRPEEYAWSKAKQATEEEGPAVLIVDIPDDVIALAVDEWFPIEQGLVQFDRGPSMDALLAVWPKLDRRIIPFRDPLQ